MRQKTILSFDGTEIYYVINKVQNSSDKLFIIFIHGAGSNHTVYKPFFTAFEDRNFVALDLRNHGHSGRAPLETITIEILAQDIEAIMKEENIKEFILVGNSLGASVALEVAKKHQKQTKNLVLFTLFSKRYIRGSSFLYFLATFSYILLKPFSGWRKLKFQDYHKYQKRPLWYYPLLDIRGTPVTTVAKLVKKLFQYHFSLSRLAVPTLLFVSLDDFSTKNSLIHSDCKGNKNITLINLKSHHVPLTRDYEEVTKHVKRFLE